MRVHVFGNSPSPAVATYGLRRAANEEETTYGNDARKFIERDFYVDDGVKSFPTEAEAISILNRAQEMLAVSNLRLHKVISNRAAVIESFPPEDRGKDIKDLNLFADDLPLQRSLGVSWNIATDTLTFQCSAEKKPYTRRGVLSTVNSLYDPLGFLAPVTIQGRLLLRELSKQVDDWDSPLPQDMEAEWIKWRDSLQDLQKLQIPRPYTTFTKLSTLQRELCLFSDASVKAIAAVAYLRVTTEDGITEVGFIFGKAKLATQPDLTIPRLELCAAVLAVEIAEMIVKEMDVFSSPHQWRFVPTDDNPADPGSRSVPAALLRTTTWLSGPTFLRKSRTCNALPQETFEVIEPDLDSEIRPLATNTTQVLTVLNPSRIERFSKWSTLVRAVACLIHVAQTFSKPNKGDSCQGWHICHSGPTVEELQKAEALIIKGVQQQCYSQELECSIAAGNLPPHSPLCKLRPILCGSGLLRVGGRITQAKLGVGETSPVIIPGRHHLATLLVGRYHEAVKHQGRHFTEGAVRQAGYWLVGAKRCISGFLFRCIIYRKLRGKNEYQQMADLPAERLQVAPPFTYVGVDVFGPWEVVSRRTRGGHSNSKRWAVLFSCICTRAVHIEVRESMSASSFINALRRFFAIRGPAKQIRSDCGTNFVGASHELKMGDSSTSSNSVEKYLQYQKYTWVFNPPHSSHMGGAWERMIGVARRIIDYMFLQNGAARLTHEVLTTFMAEVTAVINARPLIPVSSDPESPFILTPATLLTQKTGVPLPPPGDFGKGVLLKEEWKRVQSLAEVFWSRWRREYLVTLQTRRKWLDTRQNLKEGDIVLLKDKQARRNEWPMAIISKTFPSQDGKVRRVEIRISKDGGQKLYVRTITEVVLLLSPEDSGGSMGDLHGVWETPGGECAGPLSVYRY
ncbi:uncharacterized protein LOC129695020 [Leucoraja erinacea]|uniref:uncharacterized protein LOC129695020 n=1 Tax=Leucoraja erinaceus TaxID=7782 RepID=UPI002457374F|nr:uncharacterized protein LOC129695020 [Leucoraja erinacea]